MPDFRTARSFRTAIAPVRAGLLAAQPTRAVVQPGQIGALAAFLRTPAASQITGTALPVDGGWTAH